MDLSVNIGNIICDYLFTTIMNIQKYFTKLWFSQKEREVFLWLYKLWNQPASVVAKHLDMERTTVYKILQYLSEKWFISVTEKNGIKHFFVPSIWVLKNFIRKQQKKFDVLEQEFNLVEAELLRYDENFSSKLPTITLFDGVKWVHNIFDDIYKNTISQGYLSIKMFASNILDSYMYTKSNIVDYSNDFFEKIQKRNISVDVFLGNGDLIMERVSKNIWVDSIKNLPAADSAINIFVVGTAVYIIIFKTSPFALKIDSEEFANTIYFMLDNLKLEE